jgi:hypothetical protein
LLLSNILAIAIASLIAVLGIKAYQLYKHSVQVQEINLDLNRIWQVGMDYYTAEGCVWQGDSPRVSAFAGDAAPSWEQLTAVSGDVLSYAEGRPPWVKGYRLRVEREQEPATQEQVVSHYHLQVEADVSGLDTAQLQFLGKRLHATEIDEENKLLVWDRLASTLRGSQKRSYQPMQADNIGDTQLWEQDDEQHASRYNCR